jgi:hypothetical protein
VAAGVAEQGIRLEVVQLAEAKCSLVLLPKRWISARCFAWSARFRRPVRDEEGLTTVLACLHYLGFVCFTLHQLMHLDSGPEMLLAARCNRHKPLLHPIDLPSYLVTHAVHSSQKPCEQSGATGWSTLWGVTARIAAIAPPHPACLPPAIRPTCPLPLDVAGPSAHRQRTLRNAIFTDWLAIWLR